MPKLPREHRFLDLSDYGRTLGRAIANGLKNTPITAVHITLTFFVVGLLAVICILYSNYWAALALLILKSILDAADGEMARIKNTPSYIGRYLDSILDMVLNLFLLVTIGYCTQTPIVLIVLAFVGMELQGTLYNYYYVILRNKYNGDGTSRIFENEPPVAFQGESQAMVNTMFKLYNFLYGGMDKLVHQWDKSAINAKIWPNWFMTMVSVFGLGFQLLLMGIFMATGYIHYIIPFFIASSLFLVVFIGIRKSLNR